MPAHIEDYAMLGNCRSAALVCSNGSIDWLCLPRFDSDAVFAALLGTSEHGRWAINPTGEATSSRHYRDGSLVLETQFEDEHGAVRLLDFMVATQDGQPNSHLVRRVEGIRGTMKLRTEIVLRFGYGKVVPWVTQTEDGLLAVAGADQIVIRTSVPLRSHDFITDGEFSVSEGEAVDFVLSHGPSHCAPPEPLQAKQALAVTEAFWHDWSGHCTHAGPWSDLVRRSLIVLKGLSYLPTGAIIAAPTASLPEKLGGERNWDYRYCWLRDGVFVLLALLNAGYTEEAAAFRNWVKRAVAGTPGELQALYGVGGERRLTEWNADWLPGYENSQPVNIGNAAATQFQLDVYGELIGVMEFAERKGVLADAAIHDLERAFLDELEKRWQEPDEGIWEMRDGRAHFTHSKLMAWLAFDRAAENNSRDYSDEQRTRWRTLADTIKAEILERGLHKDGYFVQSYGSQRLDGSLLLIPMIGFLPPHDARVVATVEAIERDLTVDGLVERYRADDEDGDGLPPGEGTFLACSFWLVECLVMIDRHDDAKALFERLCGLCNDVGLLAEEYDPKTRRMLGNFPQGYSHVALVNAAYRLADAGHHHHRSEEVKP
ncbi:MAG: glycoside hydrolase family 15 protein [Pseudoxanthomonas sp.]